MNITDKKSINDLIASVDLKNIIKQSVQSSAENIKESYVAQAKSYPQVSERVTQKTKDAHHDLYKEYVEALNKTSAELDTVDRSSVNSNHSQFRSLKLDETYNLNGVWLHELYFANCFSPTSELYQDTIPFMRLQRDWGSFDAFQTDFLACAMSCGNGFVICGYHMFLKRYVNTIISNNSQDMMMGLYPIIVIDCHEHAYHKDYLNDKKSFVIASLREINWDVVEERFKRAESIHQTLK